VSLTRGTCAAGTTATTHVRVLVWRTPTLAMNPPVDERVIAEAYDFRRDIAW